VTAAYLAGLNRGELDELMHMMEHGTRVAQTVVAHAPLNQRSLEAACGVAQDCHALLMDIYDMSGVLWAAEFDRRFDLGGDQ
jgi:hypothetical protein